MIKQKWVINKKAGDVNLVAREQNIEPITARILLNRELGSKEERDMYLHPSLMFLRPGRLLLNAEKAAERLHEAIDREQRIRIIGDYDVDGITSTYVLYVSLKGLGADVSYKIPHRVLDGYGINKNMVDDCLDDGIDLILTCDNGISEFETIAYAKENGIDVILTDHHEIPKFELEDGSIEYRMPDADIIVNPHQMGETYPYTNFCGCVVAMKVMECMGVDIKPLLPYAAMATLCDVMELRDENRVIVSLGLAAIRKCQDIGLNALINATDIEKMNVGSYHVGFIIGPCLNATGRLDTAETALKLLMETDESEADYLAAQLVELNAERKDMTEKGVMEAISQVENAAREKAVRLNQALENCSNWEDFVDPVLCIYLPNVHESIAGIIAGRVRERFYRPTFILTDSGDFIKGSGRSTENYSMYDEMSRIKDVFIRFGGHPMAAGLSIERERLSEMTERLNANATLTQDDLTKKIKIDAKVPFNLVNRKLIGELSMLEPFGKGNEKPVLADSQISIDGIRVLGKNRNVIKLKLRTVEGQSFEGMYFCNSEEFRNELIEKCGEEETQRAFSGLTNKIRLAITYYPDINEYNGITTLQAKIQEFMIG